MQSKSLLGPASLPSEVYKDELELLIPYPVEV